MRCSGRAGLWAPVFDACGAVPRVGLVDVGEADRDAVGCVVYFGVMDAAAGGVFGPGEVVGRGEAAVVLARLADRVGVEVGGVGDVWGVGGASVAARRRAAAALRAAGLWGDASVGDLGAPAGRGEVAVWLAGLMDRMVPLAGVDAAGGRVAYGFTPAAVAVTAGVPFDDLGGARGVVREAVARLWALGVSGGGRGGGFAPGAAVTRAELAGFVAAVLAHSRARPRGLAVQPGRLGPDGTVDVLVSWRGEDFAPVAGRAVEVTTTGGGGGVGEGGGGVVSGVVGSPAVGVPVGVSWAASAVPALVASGGGGARGGFAGSLVGDGRVLSAVGGASGAVTDRSGNVFVVGVAVGEEPRTVRATAAGAPPGPDAAPAGPDAPPGPDASSRGGGDDGGGDGDGGEGGGLSAVGVIAPRHVALEVTSSVEGERVNLNRTPAVVFTVQLRDRDGAAVARGGVRVVVTVTVEATGESSSVVVVTDRWGRARYAVPAPAEPARVVTTYRVVEAQRRGDPDPAAPDPADPTGPDGGGDPDGSGSAGGGGSGGGGATARARVIWGEVDPIGLVERVPVRMEALGVEARAVGGFTVAWVAASPGTRPVESFEIQYRLAAAASWEGAVTITVDDAAARSWAVSGLAAAASDTAYLARVRAVNGVGAGAWSPGVEVVTPADRPAALDPPTVADATSGGFAVRWASAGVPPGGTPVGGYEVQWRLGAAADWAAAVTVGGIDAAARSRTVAGLAAATVYAVRVRAVSADAGDWSAAAAATTTPAAPAAPQLRAGAARLAVSWAPPAAGGDAAVVGYRVRWRAGGGGWSPSADGEAVPGGAAARAYVIGGLVNATAYDVEVAAVNRGGVGDFSAAATATPAARPAAPAEPTGTANVSSVTLTWAAPADPPTAAVTGYAVQYRAAAGGSWTTWTRTSTSPTSTTETLTGLTNGTAYVFRVRATNRIGAGPWSDPSASVTPAARPAAPAKPAGVAKVSSVTLTWVAPANPASAAITGYAVQYRAATAQNWTTWTRTSTSATSTSETVTGLTNTTAYVFRVRATNRIGTGAWSDPSSSVTPAALPVAPAKPTGVAKAASVTLTWVAPANPASAAVSGYKVQYRTAAAADWSGATTVSRTGTASTTTITGLTNATAYVFRVRAVNRIGDGPWSPASASITPAALPAAPAKPTVTGGATKATVSWVAPTNPTSAAVSGYKVQYKTAAGSTWGDWTRTGAATSVSETVTGLTNGTAYVFRVRATNRIGDGAWSPASDSVTPADAPAAPAKPAGVAKVSSVTVSWAAPADRGAAISAYAVQYKTATGGTWATVTRTGTATSTSETVTNLTNGTAYVFRVRATNRVGNSAWSSASDSVTPAALPAKVTKPTGTAKAASVTVSWVAPANPTSAAVSGYKVQYKTATGGTWATVTRTGTATSTSETVTNLVNATAYVFRVRAVNRIGDGPWSDASSNVTPAALPAAPAKPSVVGGAAKATVTWVAPTNPTSAAVSGYKVQYKTAAGSTWGDWTRTGAATSVSETVTGLSNGTAYVFRVRAVNRIGDGAWSPASESVTPADAPEAPAKPAGVAKVSSVTVTWAAPSDRGAAISAYAVQYKTATGGTWTTWTRTGTATSTSETVTNLANATAYVFRVRATNRVGNGAWSPASDQVRPAALPVAPAKPTGVAGAASVTLTWVAPTDPTTAAVSGYKVQYKTAAAENWSGATTVSRTGTATSTTVTGLTNGTAYVFRVRAVNRIGDGPWSDASGNVTPAALPAAPAKPTVAGGAAKATVTWVAPTNPTTATVTGYDVQYKTATGSTWGDWTRTGAATSVSETVTGLTNGTAYVFRVRATNRIGDGAWSPASDSVTPADVPEAPAKPTGVAKVSSVTVSWAAPATRGATISAYAVQYKTATAQNWTTWTRTGTATSTSETVTGLANGTAYVFRVRATNSVGNGAWSPASDQVRPAALPAKVAKPTGVAKAASVTLTWVAPTDPTTAAVTGYKVQHKTAAAADWSGATTVSRTGTATSATITGLTNGTAYVFRVRAVNRIGDGPWSDASGNVTPAALPAAPAKPTVAGGAAKATVTWVAPTNPTTATVTGYDVQYKTATAADWSTVSGSVSGTSTTVTGLTNGTAYVFRVRATNRIGDGAWSPASDSVTPADAPEKPAKPTGVAKVSSVTVSWAAPATRGAAISAYAVQYKTATAQSWTTWTRTGTATSTSETVTGLANATAYVFRVRATNSVGNSAWSDPSDSVTPAALPVAPAKPTGVAGAASVTLTWVAPTDPTTAAVSGYKVQYRTAAAADWSGATTVSVSGTSTTVTGLTDATAYVFRVRAVNRIGDGAWSPASSDVTPAALPAAPAKPTVVGGAAKATVTWVAPTNPTSAAVSGYDVQYKTATGSTWGDWTRTGAATSVSETVTGLSNGTAYVFRVRATNRIGDGAWSPASDSVTPADAPEKPAKPAGVAKVSSVTVSWAAPADRGATISAYAVQYKTATGGTWATVTRTGAATSTSETVTGLANATAYVFRVRATNSVGTGAWSPASASVTPAALPVAPAKPTGVAGAASVTLTWVAPADPTTAAVSGYKVQYKTAAAENWSGATTVSRTGTATSATVTGLTNGTAYVFRVRATNRIGDGAWSPASSDVTPAALPAAPAKPTVAGGAAKATVTWVAPTNPTTAAVTGYKVQYKTATGSTWGDWTRTGAATSVAETVTGLTNGTAYVFRVRAVNRIGDGAWSPASDSVTPADAPEAPAKPTGVAKVSSVTVSWAAPDTRGATISAYAVQYKTATGGTWTDWTRTSAATSTSETVTGLANGTAYVFRVRAVNSAGTGAWSPASASVTPAALPVAPAKPTGVAGAASVTLTWVAPTDSTTAAVSGYKVQYKTAAAENWSGATTVSVSGTSTTVTGLTNGTAYVFRVRAVNRIGDGPWSTASASITPAALPAAPAKPTVAGGAAKATVTWVAPTNPTTATVTGYKVQYKTATAQTWEDWTRTGAATSVSETVTGLSNGTAYVFRVRAVNRIGDGAWSPASDSVTPADAPEAPAKPTGVAKVTSVTVSWAAPDTRGAAISAYAVQYKTATGGTWTTWTRTSTATSTSETVTGLTNATAYVFRVRATNRVGNSAWSPASDSVTPAALPAKVAKPTGTAKAASVTVSWVAPANPTSAAVSGYKVQYKTAAAENWSDWSRTGGATSTSETVTNLVNATAYVFRVRATNRIGDGPWSDASGNVTPAALPAAPAKPTVTGGAAKATVTWVAPTNPTTATVTGYKVQYRAATAADWSTVSGSVSGTSTTVTGLTNGTAYVFRVRAVNRIGDGAWSPASDSVTPADAPEAPAKPTGVAKVSSVTVTWAAPDTRGATISAYAVQYRAATAQNWTTWTRTGTATSTSETVTGLTNATAYVFRVRATNRVGDGAWSPASASVTPAALPVAPAKPTGVAGAASVTLTWVAPADPTTAAVSGYKVQYKTAAAENWSGATTVSRTGTATTTTITGLTDATAYVFRVRAVNRIGDGAWSPASSDVTPAALPVAPAKPTVAGGAAKATVTWVAPTNPTTAAVTGYKVQYKTATAADWSTVSGSVSGTSTTVTGLTNGTAYVFRVRAVNRIGDGAWSPASDSVTPADAPAAPAKPTGVAGVGEVTVTWAAPADRGAAISGYGVQYKTATGGTWTTVTRTSTATSTSETVTNLTNATAYVFRVRAVNSVGNGAWSPASDSVTPAALPVAPAKPTGVAGAASVTLTWVAPTDPTTAAVTGYKVQYKTTAAASTWTTWARTGIATSTSETVTGLTDGTAYVFRVRATNRIGDGAWSPASAQITPAALPNRMVPPTIRARTADGFTVGWRTAAVPDGAAAVMGYEVQHRLAAAGNTWAADATVVTAGASARSATVTGLSADTAYLVRVRATNGNTGGAGPGEWSDPTAVTTLATGCGGLVHHWAFDEASGATVTDTGSGGDDGTITGATRVAEGRLGGALRFDGNQDYVQFGADPITAAGCGWTAGLWLRLGAAAAWKTLLSGATNSGWEVRLAQGSNEVGLTNLGQADYAYSHTATVGAWEYLTFVGTSGATTLYVNGALVGTINQGFALPLHRLGAGVDGGASINATVDDVRVYGEAKTADEVAALYAEVNADPPGAPAEATLTPAAGQLTVHWTAPATDGGAAITGYVVEHRNPGASRPRDRRWVSATAAADAVSHVISGLTDGTSYDVRVAATNMAGRGGWSARAQAAPSATAVAPGAPRGVAATPADESLVLTWTAPGSDGGADVSGYVIEHKQTSEQAWSDPATTVAATARTHTITNLTNGTSYEVRVAAKNSAGTGGWGTASGTPARPAGAPRNLGVTAVDGALELSWEAPAGGAEVSGYVVEHREAGAVAWSAPVSVGADVLSHVIGGLTNGSSYVVRVAARNSAGTGAWASRSVRIPTDFNAAPEVIPRVREWSGGTGELSLTSSSRIVVSSGDAGAYRVAESVTSVLLSQRTLAEVAAAVKADLKAVSGLDLAVVTAAAPVAGDVFLELVDEVDTGLGAEGYQRVEGYELEVGDRVTIRANTSTGVFWGSRTLLQILQQSADKKSVVRGKVRDWPSQEVRMINLDMGRRYWGMEYLEDLFRQMSWHKLNVFHMHIAEPEGFRLLLNSDDADFADYDGLADPSSSYSKADVARLEAFAKAHHISIMPGFEFPGHATVVSDHFRIGFGHGSSPCTVAHAPGGLTVNYNIDMTSATAVARAKQIVSKFSPWFSGPFVHLGADEVNQNVGNCPKVQSHISSTAGVTNLADLLVAFINDMNATIKGLGKRTVIYNGFEHSPVPSGQTLDSDVVVMFWEQSRAGITREAQRSGGEAFDILNINTGDGLYLTPNNHHNLYPAEARLYDSWVPSATDLGSGIHVWGDSNFWAEDEFFERLLRRGRAVLADRTWNATATPDDVAAFYTRLAAVGSPAGFVGYRAPARVNDGEPSHYYTFDNDGEVYPPSHHYANRPGGGQTLYVEDSVGDRHAVSFKGTDGADSVVGKSLVLTGDGIAATFGGLDIPAPWSVGVWVKRTANRNGGVLFSSRNEFGRRTHVHLEHGTTRRVAITTPADATHTFNYTAPLNTWTHLTLVATSGQTKLYVNGTLTDTINQSMPLPRHAIGTAGNVARAKLDELKVFDEALSATQVAALPRAHCASGLVHHWAFDEASGATVTDTGSGGDDGTITGATRVAEGRLGGALRFDGNQDYVQFGADPITAAGCGWTAGLWLRLGAAAAWKTLLSGATNSGWEVRLAQGSNEVGLTNLGQADYAYSHTATVGAWEYLTFVGTSGATTLYVNGALVGTINQGFALPLHRLGAGVDGGASINATVDDVRVYGEAKTADEVAALYAEVNADPPGAPAEATLTPAAGQLTVHWTAPATDGGAAITGYVVEHRNPGASRPRDRRWVSATAAADAVSHVISGLTDGTSYDVRVAATNMAGRGGWSARAQAAPSATAVAPGAPRGVAATPADESLVLTWTAPGSDGGADVSGYVIEHKQTSEQAWSDPATTVAATARTHTITNLTNGTSYEVRVAAKNSAGTGGWGTASGTPAAPLVGGGVDLPGVPGEVVLSPAGGGLVVRWSAPAGGGVGVSGYVVEYRGADAEAWSAPVSVGADVLSHTIEDLTNGSSYVVRVAATNAAGTGEWSGVVSAVVSAVVVAPGVPRGLVVAPADGSLVLAWVAPGSDGGADIAAYVVQFREAGASEEGWSDPMSVVAGSERTLGIGGLTNGVGYEVRVAARNSAGTGGWAAAGPVTAGVAALGAPGGLRVVPGDGALGVSWALSGGDGASAVTGYVVRYREESAGDEAWVEVAVGAVVVGYAITGLTNGRSYVVGVAAVNAAGTGEWASATAAPHRPPDAPRDLSVRPADGSLGLAWAPPGDDGGSAVAGYVVQYRRRERRGWSEAETVGAGAVSHTLGGLAEGKAYVVRVAATNAAGRGAWATTEGVASACSGAVVHRWAFDEASGAVAGDAGSGGADGAIVGASWVAEGRVGGALGFDGDGDWLQVGAGSISGGGCGWTAALWVKRTGETADAVLFAPAAASGGAAAIKLEQWNETHKVGITRFGDTDHTFDYAAPLGEWVHLTLVGTAAVTTLYVNGVARPTALGYGVDLPLERIGAYAGGAGSLHAVLDDVRVYGYAMGAAQVAALYGEATPQQSDAPPNDPPGDRPEDPPDDRSGDRPDDPPSGAEPPSAPPAPLPGAPGYVSVTTGVGSLVVLWAPPPGGAPVTGYVVQYRERSAASWLTAATTGAGVTYHTIDGLTGGRPYEVRVAARNDSGVGAWAALPRPVTPATATAPRRRRRSRAGRMCRRPRREVVPAGCR